MINRLATPLEGSHGDGCCSGQLAAAAELRITVWYALTCNQLIVCVPAVLDSNQFVPQGTVIRMVGPQAATDVEVVKGIVHSFAVWLLRASDRPSVLAPGVDEPARQTV